MLVTELSKAAPSLAISSIALKSTLNYLCSFYHTQDTYKALTSVGVFQSLCHVLQHLTCVIQISKLHQAEVVTLKCCWNVCCAQKVRMKTNEAA